jgi:hypothetical protein
VKLTMQVGCLAIVCATITACDTKYSAQFKAELTLQRKIAQIAGQANGAAPAVVDPNTRLDGAKAGPGLRLTVMYTLVNAESTGVNGATFEALLTPTIKENSCTNPDLRPLIDQGVVVVLEYRGKRGEPIGTVNVDRGTCGALSDPRTGTAPANSLTAFGRRELNGERLLLAGGAQCTVRVRRTTPAGSRATRMSIRCPRKLTLRSVSEFQLLGSIGG